MSFKKKKGVLMEETISPKNETNKNFFVRRIESIEETNPFQNE